MQVNHKELKEQIKISYETKTPLFIWGTTGIGKSTAVKDIAKELAKKEGLEFTEDDIENSKFGFVDVRISQLEPSDLRGLPDIDRENQRTKWLIPDWLPKNPKSKGIIFFDELNLSPPSVQATCFKRNTLIGGKEYKKIEDLKVGDKVIDKNGDLQEVYELKSRNYNDEMIEIKGRNFMPISATKEHPFLVVDDYRKGNIKHNVKEKISKPKWIKAENLKVKQYIGIPILKPTLNDEELIIKETVNIKTTIKLDEDLAKFLGYYVGDGYYSNSRIGIALNKTEKKFQKEVKELITKIFNKKVCVKKHYSDNCIDVGFNSKEIGLFLKELCGKDVYNKKIPYEILFNKNKNLLKHFLIGYFNADGHIYNQGNGKDFVGFTTTSKILALQLQQAITRFGILFSIFTQPPKTIIIKNKICNCRESYRIQSSQTKSFDLLDLKKSKNIKRTTEHFFEYNGVLWAKIDKIERKNYSGKVYNCEVKNTHSYLANNYIVHNCYQLILDRKIGDYVLPDGWVIISAGNRVEDKCNVFEMSSALCNRFIHTELMIPDKDLWFDWALENGIDNRIIAFLQFKPSDLFKFDSKNKDKAFCSPRSWAFCSKLIQDRTDKNILNILVGSAVGEATATEFIAFLRLQNKIDLKALLKNPKQVAKITEIDLKYVLLGTISEYYRKDKKLLEKCFVLCEYLEPEFAVLLLRFFKGIDKTHFSKTIIKDKKGMKLLQKYSEVLN